MKWLLKKLEEEDLFNGSFFEASGTYFLNVFIQNKK